MPQINDDKSSTKVQWVKNEKFGTVEKLVKTRTQSQKARKFNQLNKKPKIILTQSYHQKNIQKKENSG